MAAMETFCSIVFVVSFLQIGIGHVSCSDEGYEKRLQEIEKRLSNVEEYNSIAGRPPAKCDRGANFRYREYPKSYGVGIPYTYPGKQNAYHCMDNCRRDPKCLAVSISTNQPPKCLGYSEEPMSIHPSPHWNFYRIEHSKSCWIDHPVIEFMASLKANQCFDNGVLVIWPIIVYDSGDGMHSDGKYHCPVSGVYHFTLDANSWSSKTRDKFHIMKNSATILGELNFEKFDHDNIPGTVDVYTHCAADDTVWVKSAFTPTCVIGSMSMTTFFGRLVKYE